MDPFEFMRQFRHDHRIALVFPGLARLPPEPVNGFISPVVEKEKTRARPGPALPLVLPLLELEHAMMIVANRTMDMKTANVFFMRSPLNWNDSRIVQPVKFQEWKAIIADERTECESLK